MLFKQETAMEIFQGAARYLPLNLEFSEINILQLIPLKERRESSFVSVKYAQIKI